ncbi:MAG: hypothetical protein PVH88_05945 [Ignavibacteria bacterium]
MANRNMNFILLLTFVCFSQTNAQLIKLWETDEVYKAPESVVYDGNRECLYISNYTEPLDNGMPYGNHNISKADLKGNIIKYDWITNVTTPTGICINNDKLFIVERFGVIEYDLKNEKISNKYLIKTSRFLNDITVDPDDNIYVSVSDSDVIYKISNGRVEEWIRDISIDQTNGILIDNNKLIVAVNSDHFLKYIDITTKEIKKIAYLGPGILDGIKKCGDDYLVSHYEGNLNLVSLSGRVTELLNTRDRKINIADFEFIKNKGLLITPALKNNKLYGYQYKKP